MLEKEINILLTLREWSKDIFIFFYASFSLFEKKPHFLNRINREVVIFLLFMFFAFWKIVTILSIKTKILVMLIDQIGHILKDLIDI